MANYLEMAAVRGGIDLVEWRAWQEEGRRLRATQFESRNLYEGAIRLAEVVHNQLLQARSIYFTANAQLEQHNCNPPQPEPGYNKENENPQVSMMLELEPW